MKAYDKSYFDRFYRHPSEKVSTQDGLERKVRMAVAVTEFLLARKIRTVLDIACGEAPWFPVLKRMRPNLRYVGVDSSEYVLERFGVSRNIRRGDIRELASLRLPRRVDLVVCADVLQYLPTADVERALVSIHELMGGVAYIETFVAEDGMEGDLDGWHERSERDYRRLLRSARLTQCGPYCYVDADHLDRLNKFEHCSSS